MPMVNNDSSASTYPLFIGLLYFFNLIIGTGALALPKAFQSAGFVLGVIVSVISAFASYVTATFVIECLAISNAVIENERTLKESDEDDDDDDDQMEEANGLGSRNSSPSFEIKERVELSRMAHLFLGRTGILFAYLALNVYLFGDLAIYAATIPKSVMHVICDVNNDTLTVPCRDDWKMMWLSRRLVYQSCVLAFIALITPAVLVGVSRTKYLQMATSFCRWIAFSLMIVLATSDLISTGAKAHPPPFRITGFGHLFGIAVYAFMCHHSIPGVVTPIRSKRNLHTGVGVVYGVVLMFYCILSLQGCFAFVHLEDLYTLSFLHDGSVNLFFSVCDHFLALFPVFTLTSNFPIVAITLINNLKMLASVSCGSRPLNDGISQEGQRLLGDQLPGESVNRPQLPGENVNRSSQTDRILRIMVPMIVLLVPLGFAMATDNIMLLATITGSYPGVGVQFILPSLLIIGGRRFVQNNLRITVPVEHGSPFQHKAWPWLIFAWSAFTCFIVTYNIIADRF